MNFRIELRNIGRNKICRNILTSKPSLLDAVDHALLLCSRYLVSRDIEIIQKNGNNYHVTAGFRKVGEINIVPIDEEEKIIS